MMRISKPEQPWTQVGQTAHEAKGLRIRLAGNPDFSGGASGG